MSLENIRQCFVFSVAVHIPHIFPVSLTYSLKINSLLFDPPCRSAQTAGDTELNRANQRVLGQRG